MGYQSKFKAESQLMCKKGAGERHVGTWTWGFSLDFASGKANMKMDDPVWTKK